MILEANGVDLCVESFGDPADPPILLIMGASGSMDRWEDGFCERLAAGPRFVIRYDNRDTGRSVSYEPGVPPYKGSDLAADAVGLLDTFGLAAAHLVGISMGGGIAQFIALDSPERVASLTLISTSPAVPGAPEGRELPPMSEKLVAAFAEPAPEPDWADRAAVIDYMVEADRLVAGSLPFDEAAMRDLAGRIFDRTDNIASSMTNHWSMEGDDDDPAGPRLGRVSAPTLVVHGTEDPLFPYGHAQALADEIPGARLLPLERIGHEFPRAVWGVVAPAILRHTSPA
jgi:pimeloyl-ACP methyl ester carboxylesterase